MLKRYLMILLKKISRTILIMFYFIGFAFSQEGTVYGFITDEKSGEALIGAIYSNMNCLVQVL